MTDIPGKDVPGFILKPVTRDVIRPSVTCHWLCVIAGAGPRATVGGEARIKSRGPRDPDTENCQISGAGTSQQLAAQESTTTASAEEWQLKGGNIV